MRQEVQTIKSSLYIYQAKHCKKCGSQVPHFSNASPLAASVKRHTNIKYEDIYKHRTKRHF